MAEECNQCGNLLYYGASCEICEIKCDCKKGDFFESITGEMICRCMLNNTAKKLREDKNENGKNMGDAK